MPSMTLPNHHLTNQPHRLSRSDYWRLTIHHFPRAAEAGVQPQPTLRFLDDSPAAYRPHDLDFERPPSRDEFLSVLAMTPWMACWQDSLLPVIQRNQWPVIDSGHKRSTTDLIDGEGRLVGRLEVSRHTRFRNVGYRVPFVSGSDVEGVINRRIRDRGRREQARRYVDDHRNLILERLASNGANTRSEVERVLMDGGFKLLRA